MELVSVTAAIRPVNAASFMRMTVQIEEPDETGGLAGALCAPNLRFNAYAKPVQDGGWTWKLSLPVAS